MLIDTVNKHVKKLNLKKKSTSLKVDILKEKERIAELEERLQKEFNDVEMLKVSSLPRLFHEMIGSLDEQLSKEEQELQKVQAKYVLALESLDILKSEKKRVNSELKKFKNVDRYLARLGREKPPQDNDYLTSLAYKLANTYSNGYRFKKALRLGERSKQDLLEVKKSLTQLSKLLSEYHPTSKSQSDLLNKSRNSMNAYNREVKKKKHLQIAILQDEVHEKTSQLTSIRKFLMSIQRHTPAEIRWETNQALEIIEDLHDLVTKQTDLLAAEQQKTLRSYPKLIQEWEAFNSPFD